LTLPTAEPVRSLRYRLSNDVCGGHNETLSAFVSSSLSHAIRATLSRRDSQYGQWYAITTHQMSPVRICTTSANQACDVCQPSLRKLWGSHTGIARLPLYSPVKLNSRTQHQWQPGTWHAFEPAAHHSSVSGDLNTNPNYTLVLHLRRGDPVAERQARRVREGHVRDGRGEEDRGSGHRLWQAPRQDHDQRLRRCRLIHLLVSASDFIDSEASQCVRTIAPFSINNSLLRINRTVS
jgi:hypothetical protein